MVTSGAPAKRPAESPTTDGADTPLAWFEHGQLFIWGLPQSVQQDVADAIVAALPTDSYPMLRPAMRRAIRYLGLGDEVAA